jgi:rhamnose utilization protein RhaD (predicted bifunctional aldolase and dehydrogenase)
MSANNFLHKSIADLCVRISKDRLLVQGAGGNISWKNGNVLWVKSSGSWLADANTINIFVPVNLDLIRLAISNGDFFTTPQIIGNSSLRPSVETLLHALMPHKVVVHLHAVEILAYLVRPDPVSHFKRLIDHDINWCFIDYKKPGAELAEVVSKSLLKQQNPDILLLRNHGLVIGGDRIADVEIILQRLSRCLKNRIDPLMLNEGVAESARPLKLQDYVQCTDYELNQLATNNYLASRLKGEWALYPDHVVFLGDKAFILDHTNSVDTLNALEKKPAFVFDIGNYVYENKAVTAAQKAQLRCYYDLLIRQPSTVKLVSLSPNAIAELINWEAEHYRKKLSE